MRDSATKRFLLIRVLFPRRRQHLPRPAFFPLYALMTHPDAGASAPRSRQPAIGDRRSIAVAAAGVGDAALRSRRYRPVRLVTRPQSRVVRIAAANRGPCRVRHRSIRYRSREQRHAHVRLRNALLRRRPSHAPIWPRRSTWCSNDSTTYSSRATPPTDSSARCCAGHTLPVTFTVADTSTLTHRQRRANSDRDRGSHEDRPSQAAARARHHQAVVERPQPVGQHRLSLLFDLETRRHCSLQEWQSEAALDNHFQMPYMIASSDKIPTLGSSTHRCIVTAWPTRH